MRGQVQDGFLVVATSSVICFANATFPSGKAFEGALQTYKLQFVL